MSITGISGTSSLATMAAQTSTTQKPTAPQHTIDPKGPSFGDRVSGAIDNLAETQKSAANAAKDYEMGKTDDLAAVMVEQQVASLGFQMTMQVRNKALTAYKDIMNMPV